MKKFLCAMIMLMSFTAPSFAILPPLWQNVAELKAIFNDKQLENKLESGEVIQEIRKTDSGWTIFTNHNQLSIKVIYKKISQPGPAQFTLEFGNPLRKNS